MNTTEAMTYIEQRNALGSELGLDNIKELLKRLGDPQDQCRVVHIAGTNGRDPFWPIWIRCCSVMVIGPDAIVRLRYLHIWSGFRSMEGICRNRSWPDM